MKPSEKLKHLDITNVMTAIDNIEFIEWDMDRLYNEMFDADSLQMAVTTILDDLLSVSFEMAFLKGMQFQRKLNSFVNAMYE